MASIRHYYAGVYSSKGYYSLHSEALKQLTKIYVLDGPPGTGKSTLMRKAGLVLMDAGYSLDYIHTPLDQQSIEGVLFPELSIGIITNKWLEHVDPTEITGELVTIDFHPFINQESIVSNEEAINKLNDDLEDTINEVYKSFKAAKELHIKKEEIYLSMMNFDKANEVTEQLLQTIFERCHSKYTDLATEISLFFGAATPEGPVNFIENLTADANRRVIIKGRPGSGKSTMMKKIVSKAKELGYSVAIFPCGFDPSSLDMVWIDELKTAVLDGTSPHEINPFRDVDEVVDMFELCIDPAVEQTHATELNELDLGYKQLMTEGKNLLSRARQIEKSIEEYYTNATDYSKINKQKDELCRVLLDA